MVLALAQLMQGQVNSHIRDEQVQRNETAIGKHQA